MIESNDREILGADPFGSGPPWGWTLFEWDLLGAGPSQGGTLLIGAESSHSGPANF